MKHWLLAGLLLPALAGAAVPTEPRQVVALWRADCAPCMRELAALPALAQAHPAVPFVLILLHDDPAAQARLHGLSFPPNVMPVTATDADRTMAAMGDRQNRLPYQAMLGQNGAICRWHYGMLGSATLNAWVHQC